jgi:tRNA A37 threonylcarbamoyladenosine modification protein TsaB
MDARRGEVFAAVYDEKLRPVVQEVALGWAEFTRLLGDREVTLVASSLALFEAGGAASGAPGRWSRMVPGRPLAEAIAGIAAERCASGQAVGPQEVDANYVRRTDAELNWVDPA